jgi:hypothetical protein
LSQSDANKQASKNKASNLTKATDFNVDTYNNDIDDFNENFINFNDLTPIYKVSI